MRALQLALPLVALIGCTASGDSVAAAPGERPFEVRPIATFDEPWAMTFLPGGRQALVTEKKGKLKIVWSDTGRVGEVAGAPTVDYGGQGGFGDVVLHPRF